MGSSRALRLNYSSAGTIKRLHKASGFFSKYPQTQLCGTKNHPPLSPRDHKLKKKTHWTNHYLTTQLEIMLLPSVVEAHEAKKNKQSAVQLSSSSPPTVGMITIL